MGREVRMVPKDWEHPKDHNGRYIPLLYGYEEDLAQFQKEVDSYGLSAALDDHGGGPVSDEYMLPGVPKEERTHYMMYEDTSEGTPISPAFETPEELAQWLADNAASAFGGMTASYDDWLRTIQRGWAVNVVLGPGPRRPGARSGGLCKRFAD